MMRLITAVVYFLLLSIFVGSSCVLFLLVSGESLIINPSVLQNYSHNEDDIVDVNFTNSENTSGEIKNEILVEEISSSFNEAVLSTIRPEKATEELLPAPLLKYSLSLEEAVKEAEVVSALNRTAGGEGPGPPEQGAGDIPSFSEWAKKQLEARGENGTSGSGNAAPSAGQSSNQSQGPGKGRKNYASPDCGAKVVGANPEAVSPSSLLSNTRDEYLLNPCTADIFVIVELCEPIQPQRIELANFELFSSSPRELSVHLSDYPSREWTFAARLEAKDERIVQSFQLPHLPQFVKFIRLDLHSHYGTEHFCPLSLFRVYGTSEYEVLETVDSGGEEIVILEEFEEPPVTIPDLEEPKNLFGSAKAAVLSLVRRAAEVLVVKSPSRTGNNSCQQNVQPPQYTDHCITPSYLLLCDNCSDHFFYRVYNLVCCQQEMLKSLLGSEFVSGVVERSGWCSRIGFKADIIREPVRPIRRPKPKTSPNTRSSSLDYVTALLSPETMAALCNMMAVSKRRVVLNMTSEEPAALPINVISSGEITELLTSLPTQKPLKDEQNESSPSADTDTTATPAVLATDVLPSPVVNPSTILALTISKDITATNGSFGSSDNKTTEGMNNVTLLDTNGTADAEAASLESILSELDAGESNSSEGIVTSIENVTISTTGESTLVIPEGNSSYFIPTTTASTPARSPTVPKESALVRLAHRIKALETNMSLSSQYLEQLSLHHKRQVEDLQRRLDSLTERQAAVTGQMDILIQRVDAITNTLAEIIRERETWHYKVIWVGQHGMVILVEVCLFVCLVGVCRWVGFAVWQAAAHTPVRSGLRRRRSLDDIPGRIAAHARRPSHTALQVSGATHTDLLVAESKRKTSRTENRKKKRRKREAEESPPVAVPVEVTTTARDAVMSTSSIGSSVVAVNGNAMSSSESVESRHTDSSSTFMRTTSFLRKQRISRPTSNSASSSSVKTKKAEVIKKFFQKLF